MNIDELLERWREDAISREELTELTALLDQRQHRERLLDDWLVGLGLPDALSTLAVVTSMKHAERDENRRVIHWFRHPVALAACAVLLLTGPIVYWYLGRQVRDISPDLAALQNSIAQLSVEPPSTMPKWTSPTASLLEPPRSSP
jgi:hypothetical protein